MCVPMETAARTIEELVGKVIIQVEQLGDEELLFNCSDGTKYRMYHSQCCSEDVSIEDIAGNLDDLLNSPLTMAEVVTNERGEDGCPEPKEEWHESYTWTYYKFATVKGYVTVRWYGESNGFYSESARIDEISVDGGERTICLPD